MSTAKLKPHGAAERKLAGTDVIALSFMLYVYTFQQLDARATLRQLHMPFVFVDEQMRVFSTTSEIEAFVATVMRDLASRAYRRVFYLPEPFRVIIDVATHLPERAPEGTGRRGGQAGRAHRAEW